MCQLTLVASKSLYRKLLIQQIMEENSLTNPDGWGIKTINNCEKSELSAEKDNTFSDSLEKITDTIILGHVRLSSFVIKGTRIHHVSKEDSHPFDYEYVALAHNGFVKIKDEKNPLINNQMIDSEQFTAILNNERKTKDFITALQDTKKQFWGIFAFLIFDKKEGVYYIVRGKKKELNVAYLSFFIGKRQEKFTIINTSEISLKAAIRRFLSLVKTIKPIDDVKLDINLLKHDSIYKFNEKIFDVELVGELSEEEEPVKEDANKSLAVPVEENVIKTLEQTRSFFDFGYSLGYLNLEIEEIDFLFGLIFQDDLLDFNLRSIVDADRELLKALDKSYSLEKYHLWNFIKEEYKKMHKESNILSIYGEYELEFPYMLNSSKTLRNTLNLIKNERRKEIK